VKRVIGLLKGFVHAIASTPREFLYLSYPEINEHMIKNKEIKKRNKKAPYFLSSFSSAPPLAIEISTPWEIIMRVSSASDLPPVATARGFITPSSLSSLWGLWPPLPGVIDSFLVLFVFVEHARVHVPTLYPVVRDASRLAICTVGNPPSSVNTQSLVSDYQ